MKKLARLVVWVAVAFLATKLMTANAVVIEGTTPAGQFKTVGLDAQGNFKVAIGSGTPAHVIVDTPVAVFPTTGAVFNVSGTISVSTLAPVAVSVAGAFTTTASTIATTVNNQFTVSPVASTCYPVDVSRKQGVICNSGDSINIYIGAVGGTSTGNGAILGPGSCYSPDVPSSYIGGLDCVSTTTATGFYIYGK